MLSPEPTVLARVTRTGRRPAALRVVIVGGGAAGVIAATHLLRAAGERTPVDVTLVDRTGTFGPGLPYATTHPRHTLNNYAGRLSAVDGDPDHLVRWCRERGHDVGPMAFLQRGLYGRYLADVLDSADVPPGSSLTRSAATVTHVEAEGGEQVVRLSGGEVLRADHVVLALGTPPARWVREFHELAERQGAGFVSDPWGPELVERVQGARRVLLAGTGQTAMDVVAVLHDAAPDLRFTAVSRRALLPEAHTPGTARLHDIFHPGEGTLDELLALMAQRYDELVDVGGDWRDLVDSVRAGANDLWRQFSDEEQETFAHELARHWEVARHRLPPAAARHVRRLIADGVLEVRASDDLPEEPFDVVISCTGPAPTATRGWNPLVDALLDTGVLRPHRLGLGVELSPEGHPVSTSGEVQSRLHVVGQARRGLEWEVTAVPDLRTQSARLATLVLGTGLVEHQELPG